MAIYRGLATLLLLGSVAQVFGSSGRLPSQGEHALSPLDGLGAEEMGASQGMSAEEWAKLGHLMPSEAQHEAHMEKALARERDPSWDAELQTLIFNSTDHKSSRRRVQSWADGADVPDHSSAANAAIGAQNWRAEWTGVGCMDPLATNTDAAGDCTYDCEQLKKHYFGSDTRKRVATRCFVFDSKTKQWPSEFLARKNTFLDWETLVEPTAAASVNFDIGKGAQCTSVAVVTQTLDAGGQVTKTTAEVKCLMDGEQTYTHTATGSFKVVLPAAATTSVCVKADGVVSGSSDGSLAAKTDADTCTKTGNTFTASKSTAAATCTTTSTNAADITACGMVRGAALGTATACDGVIANATCGAAPCTYAPATTATAATCKNGAGVAVAGADVATCEQTGNTWVDGVLYPGRGTVSNVVTNAANTATSFRLGKCTDVFVRVSGPAISGTGPAWTLNGVAGPAFGSIPARVVPVPAADLRWAGWTDKPLAAPRSTWTSVQAVAAQQVQQPMCLYANTYSLARGANLVGSVSVVSWIDDYTISVPVDENWIIQGQAADHAAGTPTPADWRIASGSIVEGSTASIVIRHVRWSAKVPPKDRYGIGGPMHTRPKTGKCEAVPGGGQCEFRCNDATGYTHTSPHYGSDPSCAAVGQECTFSEPLRTYTIKPKTRFGAVSNHAWYSPPRSNSAT